jgi:GntR family transcriptional regulator of arabinose operon
MLDVERIKHALLHTTASPLHARLSDAILDQITDGTLKPGEALPSERAIHEALEISRATLRQALRSLAQAGLLHSTPGAGNFVLERRHTEEGKTEPGGVREVGILTESSRFYVYFANFASAFSQVMREAGYSVDLAMYNSEEAQFHANLNSLLRNSPAALVIHPPGSFSITPTVDRLLEQGVRLICVGRDIRHPGVDYVGVDNRMVGYQAAHHLLQLGHQSILFFAYNFQSTSVFDRAEGYTRAVLEAGLKPRIHILNQLVDISAPQDLVQWIHPQVGLQPLLLEVLQRRATAAFCFNDELALLLGQQLRNLNLSVPRDFSLVGVDNLPFFGSLDAPLTTIALPGDEVGRQAAGLLRRRIAGEQALPQRLFIPPYLVQRLSAALPPPKIPNPPTF